MGKCQNERLHVGVLECSLEDSFVEPISPKGFQCVRRKVAQILNGEAPLSPFSSPPLFSPSSAQAVFQIQSRRRSKVRVAFDTSSSEAGAVIEPIRAAVVRPRVKVSGSCFIQDFDTPLLPDNLMTGNVVVIDAALLPGTVSLRRLAKLANVVLLTKEGKVAAQKMLAESGVHGVVFNSGTWFDEVRVPDGRVAYTRPCLLRDLEEANMLHKVLIVESSISASKGYRQNTLLMDLANRQNVLESLHKVVSLLTESGKDVPNFLQSTAAISIEKRNIVANGSKTTVSIAVAGPAVLDSKPGLENATITWWRRSSIPQKRTLPPQPTCLRSMGPEQALPLVEPLPLPIH